MGRRLLAHLFQAGEDRGLPCLKRVNDDGIEFERKLFYFLFATRDAHEGMHAFVDKRQPAYEGH